MSAVFEIAIETDADGVIRVGGTRVTLDTLVEAFNEGATAEVIAQQYSGRFNLSAPRARSFPPTSPAPASTPTNQPPATSILITDWR